MIGPYDYINAMQKNEAVSNELNEIIYRISGEFWKEAYNTLLRNQKSYEPDPHISVQQVILKLKKEIKDLANKNQLKYSSFSHNEHIYVSIFPYPIYIGIERNTGDFSISTPHMATRHFNHVEYKAGLNWIQEYIDIDLTPLNNRIQAIKEKLSLNEKSSQIISSSIKALCDSILGEKHWDYKIQQSLLKSIIIFQTFDKTAYEIEVYHKPFTTDSTILINLLNNPREETIEDFITCGSLSWTEKLEAV